MKMYKFFVLVAAVSMVNCATISKTSKQEVVTVGELKKLKTAVETVRDTVVIPILSQDSQIDPEGSFKWSYESADGTKVEQVGEIKTLDNENTVEAFIGSYAYLDPEGKSHAVHYVANENGFIPSGDDIAPEIVKHLEYIASHPHPVNTEDFASK